MLCTRNPGLDIDIEAIGCGLWVNVGDAAAWARAIARLPRDRVALDAMGERGMQFAAQHLDMAAYSAQVERIVRGVLGTTEAPRS